MIKTRHSEQRKHLTRRQNVKLAKRNKRRPMQFIDNILYGTC
jgi:hypothetical protein